ncbi:hypothetical protein BB559_001411 [Furculomyces boomerangus]|uniref:Uncharacterized protein n=2 Tax=Harpellales TaxID=61421 RepID=A0A2T9Z219_9FUNG|nr:hypothetical protein BB559_001411 [Furculomyces boomerangus]PWA03602.1 hypothetical protein BB558_000279 [Smittium angustum]
MIKGDFKDKLINVIASIIAIIFILEQLGKKVIRNALLEQLYSRKSIILIKFKSVYRPLISSYNLLVDSSEKNTEKASDTPVWQCEPFILSGYRKQTFSYTKCFKSIFYLHNESVNILSHLFGVFLFLYMFSRDYYTAKETFVYSWHSKRNEFIIISFYNASAVFCMLFSSIYHTFNCHSKDHSTCWLKIDFIGILVLIFGTFLTGIYYGFYYFKWLFIFYTSLISIISIAALIVSVSEKFSNPHGRALRAKVFSGIAISGILPLLNIHYIYGIDMILRSIILQYLFYSLILYGIGVVIYANRFPERFWPGKFDLFMGSHQLFHISVLLAAYTYYHALSYAFFNDYILTLGYYYNTHLYPYTI